MGVSTTMRLHHEGARQRRQSVTLEQVRSELSHECAAKMGRMLAILRAWGMCDLHESDREQMLQLLARVLHIHQRYARIVLRHPVVVWPYCQSLLACLSLRRRLLTVTEARLPSGRAVRAMIADLEALRSRTQTIVRGITRAYAVPLRDVVADAVVELKSEYPTDPVFAFVAEEESGRVLLPREDARRWSDILVNVMRNAVQAVKDRVVARQQAAGDASEDVRVELRAHPSGSGVVLEVTDTGVGMEPEHVPAMWRAGKSRHGQGRGQGLTEEKHAFIIERAALSVRTAPGVGTSVRIEFAQRDISVEVPLLQPARRSRALVLALVGILLGAMPVAQRALRPVDIVRLEANGHSLSAWDGASRRLWSVRLDGPMLRNDRARRQDIAHDSSLLEEPLVMRDAKGRGVGVIIATGTGASAARLYRLSARGQTQWQRTLAWTPPISQGPAPLTAVAEMPLRWGSPPFTDVVAVNVRRGNAASTAIQFFSWAGDSLAAYYHPGMLEYEATGDFDGDRTEELLLSGKNNDAAEWLGVATGQKAVYLDCIAMLSGPRVSGQAYPYQRWKTLAPSLEKGYLVIPPLTRAQVTNPTTVPGSQPKVVRVQATIATAQSSGRVQITIDDGRIYVCDAHLRPLQCGAGDRTLAQRLGPVWPVAPCIYLHEGKLERIELEVR